METNSEEINMAMKQCALVLPKRQRTRKQPISIRIDVETLERFRASGKGWQTRINEMLRDSLGHQGVSLNP